MTIVRDFRALISDYRLNAMASVGTPVFITFSFLSNSEVPSLAAYEPYDNDGYFAFSAAQQASFLKAVGRYAKVAGVQFIEVDDPDDAMLLVMNAAGSDWAGWANYGRGTRDGTNQGYLVIDQPGTYAPGSYGFEAILHELGHVTGLKHPFDGNPRLTSDLDNDNHTLMSYTSNGINDRNLAHLDIDALRHLYGGSDAVKDAWTWSFNDSSHIFHLRGSGQADKLIGTDTDTRILGGGGNDRIFGRDEDDTAFGQNGNDHFMLGPGTNEARGGKGNDVFFDYWGDDLFVGGPGRDTVNFAYAPGAVFVDLGTTDPQYNLGRNILIGIENVMGSARGDQIIGSDVRNVLAGARGADVVLGEGGPDLLRGNRGADELDGGVGRDVLIGGGGDDLLTGGAGTDVFKFSTNAGADEITDFVDGEDRILLTGFGFANRAQARAQFHEIDTATDNTVGFDHRGTTIIIHGVDLTDITLADILI